jgi:hypothetical protein
MLHNLDILLVPGLFIGSFMLYIIGIAHLITVGHLSTWSLFAGGSMFCLLYPYWKSMRFYHVTETFVQAQLKSDYITYATIWSCVVAACYVLAQ